MDLLVKDIFFGVCGSKDYAETAVAIRGDIKLSYYSLNTTVLTEE